MKKKTLIMFSTESALILATTTFGQSSDSTVIANPNSTPANQPTETGLLTQISGELSSLPHNITTGITAGMNSGFADLETSLETFLDDLYHDGKTWVSQRDHAYNPNLPGTISLNNISVPLSEINPSQPNSKTELSLLQAMSMKAQEATANNIKNSLLQFSYSLNQSNTSQPITSAEGMPYANYLQENTTQSLLLGENAGASDSLYLPKGTGLDSLTAIDPDNEKLLAPPPSINNGQLDFSNIITPIAYTPVQQQDASNFVKYAMFTTKNLLGKVSFSGLYGNAKAIISLKKSPDYQDFMMTIRNMLAVRSMTLSVYNQLVAERTPIPNLGQAIGQTGSASPLQVEEYRATHDLNNPSWYYALTNEEPATVQRDILITLKEIERQNFEAKLQNERLLAVMMAATLQGGSSMDTLLEMQQNKLQTAVNNAMKAGAPANQNTNDGSTAGGLSSGVSVSNITSASAYVAWGAVTNATGTVKYQVTVTGPNNSTVYQQSTQSIEANVVGLAPNTAYSVTVSPSQGTGGSGSFQTLAAGKK